MHLVKFFILMQFLFSHSAVFAAFEVDLNLTDFLVHRQKRGLIFEGGGSIKISVGPSFPVNLGDPISFRSVVCSYSLQGGQYQIIKSPIYPWDRWEETFSRSLHKRPRERGRGEPSAVGRQEEEEEEVEDASRLFVYTVLESYMNGRNVDGRECLLRAICENAQTDQHIGLLTELLNILLTPDRTSVDPIYHAAFEAGRSGVDCLQLHRKCPRGASVFDQFMDEV